MSSRRITIALVGLIILVVVGYLIHDLTGDHHAAGQIAPSVCSVHSAGYAAGTQDGSRFCANAVIPS